MIYNQTDQYSDTYISLPEHVSLYHLMKQLMLILNTGIEKLVCPKVLKISQMDKSLDGI